MRLYLYYTLHTLLNQLKKLFKTWVLLFLVFCVVFGVVIGLIAAAISGHVENGGEDHAVQEEMGQEGSYSDGIVPEDDMSDLWETLGIEKADLVELVAGAIMLLVFVYLALSADKNGSRIFLPADVNILFPSPMKPQSVLMFRLATQLGAVLLGSLYMLLQIPNLVINMGLSMGGALGLILVWCLTIMSGTLLQLLLYALTSTYPGVKKYLRPGVYGVLLLLAGGFVLFWKQGNGGVLQAASGFFGSTAFHLTPILGWLMGICRAVVEGERLTAAIYLAVTVVAMAALIYIIWHIKVDFYEDAMAKSEETAALLEKARSEKNTNIIIKKEKERSGKIRRDGLRHGRGANVFFFKTMYNRFRFAHFGFSTKTMELYLVSAICVCVLCRQVFETKSVLPLGFTLTALVFLRSMGNPLKQDTKMDYFIMIPESAWAKLFWSLMGGMANCLLDLLLPLIVGALILGTNPLKALVWLPFMLTMDFYSTTVGVFIDLSVPVNAGVMIKQLVQIMFVYFGLLPDIGILTAGILTGHLAIAMMGTVFLNLALGGLFYGLSPIFLDP